MGDRVYLVIDGIDARVHHIEFADPARLDELRAAPAISGPWPSDRNIAMVANDGAGVYQPSWHVERIRDHFERQGKDPEAFVRSIGISCRAIACASSNLGSAWRSRGLSTGAPSGWSRPVTSSREADGAFFLPRNLVATLERHEVERVGNELARARGMTFHHTKVGEYVSGTLAGSTELASGRFAVIEDGPGFSLVPWQPVLDQRIGRHITGLLR